MNRLHNTPTNNENNSVADSSNKEITQRFEDQLRRTKRSSYMLFTIAGTVIFVLFILLYRIPYSISDWPDLIKNHWRDAGPVGDVFGGILGPPIAFIGMIVTFIAFYIQYVANLEQRTQFQISLAIQENELRKEKKRADIERFEGRYFELLRLHKENVSEMNIANRLEGRRCFVPMFYELRHIYINAKLFQVRMATEETIKPGLLEVDVLNLAYKIFFYGVGDNSEKHFIHKLTKDERALFDRIKWYITEKVQKAWENREEEKRLNPNLVDGDACYTYNNPVAKSADDLTLKMYYKPYDGHVNLLGHYYRHLYQTATYVLDQGFLKEKEKYQYLKTLRAQLSNFEQLMLYYNASAWFKKEWEQLFTQYKFIRNIPLDLADFDISPQMRYKDYMEHLAASGDKLFEQQ